MIECVAETTDFQHDPHDRGSTSGSWREARTQAILRAALEELAQVGYSAFSIEAVATRAGVAKTTVYRRYATKAELVRSAILQFLSNALGEPPDTGTLRGDLIELGRQTQQLASSILGQGLFRTQLLDRAAPELEAIGQEFERERELLHNQIASRAIARGEIASPADFERVVHVLSGTLLFKQVMRKQSVDELEIVRIVDMLLNGAPKPATRSRHGA
jgi:AcrR family transcriptional regulator